MTWSSTLATGVVEGKSLRGTDCKVSGGQIVWLGDELGRVEEERYQDQSYERSLPRPVAS